MGRPRRKLPKMSYETVYDSPLPFDEAVFYRAVFVIVSGADGRTDGWKRFWSQLTNSKWLEIDHLCQWVANRNPWARYWMGQPRPLYVSPNSRNRGIEKSPFQISVNWLEVDENVNMAHFRTHWLIRCEVMQWTIVQLSSKPQTSESRSSTICVVVERPGQHCVDDLVPNS